MGKMVMDARHAIDAVLANPDADPRQVYLVGFGMGGMVGAGIFSILGVVAQAAGNAMWIAFAIGGVVALLSTYSYAKLGARFPSAGGASASTSRRNGADPVVVAATRAGGASEGSGPGTR
jgi:hypothetical protein